jgi:hypothetical protein
MSVSLTGAMTPYERPRSLRDSYGAAPGLMMTNYMIVRQKVTDLCVFQTAFDRLKPDREAAGLTDLGQFCAADEANVVVVLLEVADLSRAKKYWHSDVLAQGRADAGIIGPNDAKSATARCRRSTPSIARRSAIRRSRSPLRQAKIWARDSG